jgi:tetratricopeptide (TPR) repeat protein
VRIPYYTRDLRDGRMGPPGRAVSRPLPYGATLLQPYLDLSPAEEGPLHARLLLRRYDALVQRELAPWPAHQSGAFRHRMLYELRLPHYEVVAPADLAVELRTRPWQRLVDEVEAFTGLDWTGRFLVVDLLQGLGLYDCVLALTGDLDVDPLSAQRAAVMLWIRRGEARLRLTRSPQASADLRALLAAVAAAPCIHPRTRLGAALTLLVGCARARPADVAGVRRWRRMAQALVRVLHPDDDWVDAIYLSSYWRAASYLPFLLGDPLGVRTELDRAERLARAVPANTPTAAVVRDQTLHPLLETKTKVALWAGDLDEALRLAKELVQLDPYDPKVVLELGDVHLQRGDLEAALASYREAARLGPPYTAMAWHAVGRCRELLGDPIGALEAYLVTLDVDPVSISAATRLRAIAHHDRRPALARWSGGLVTALEPGPPARARVSHRVPAAAVLRPSPNRRT